MDDSDLVAFVTVVAAAAPTVAEGFDVLPPDRGDGRERYLPDGG